ncbi:hypothetical protein BKA62DRAFT_801283 [Auriculariales sp. MPI-PUGE-AT-0066]|nr:hypothetical protein BKA62DRAFT_801283 [Auriculariales sp. MPI-PUGE-AT-0066]
MASEGTSDEPSSHSAARQDVSTRYRDAPGTADCEQAKYHLVSVKISHDEIIRLIPERRSQLDESYPFGRWNGSGPSDHTSSLGQNQSLAHLDFGLFDASVKIPRSTPVPLDATDPNVPHMARSRQSFGQSNSSRASNGATGPRQAVDSLQHGPDSQVHGAIPARGAESVQPPTNGTAALSHESGSRDSAPLVVPSRSDTVHPYIANSPFLHGPVGFNKHHGRNVLPLPPVLVPSQAHMTPEDISRARSRSWARYSQDSLANMPLPLAEGPAQKRTKRPRSPTPDHVAQALKQSLDGPDPDCRVPYKKSKLIQVSYLERSPPVSPVVGPTADTQAHAGYTVFKVIPQAAETHTPTSTSASSPPSGSVGPPLVGVPSSSTSNATSGTSQAESHADLERDKFVALAISRVREHQKARAMHNNMRGRQRSTGDNGIVGDNLFFISRDVHDVWEGTASNASIQPATETDNIKKSNTRSLNIHINGVQLHGMNGATGE